jgi:hypothetical protein
MSFSPLHCGKVLWPYCLFSEFEVLCWCFWHGIPVVGRGAQSDTFNMHFICIIKLHNVDTPATDFKITEPLASFKINLIIKLEFVGEGVRGGGDDISLNLLDHKF